MKNTHSKGIGITLYLLFSFLLIQPAISQKTWLPTNSIDSFPVFCLTSIDNQLYAGMVKGGIYKTIDEGKTWTACNVGLEDTSPNQIIKKGNNLFAATAYNGVFVSSDKGESWMPTSTTIHQRVFALAAKGKWLFAGTANGLYRSEDEGENWERLNHGYTSSLYQPIYALLFVGNKLLAGSKKYVFSTDDDGINWNTIKVGTSGDIRVLKQFGSEIYIGSSANGVYKTPVSSLQDNKEDWEQLKTISPELANIKALVMADDKIVVGVPTKGVNMGEALENNGLPSALIGSLAFHKGKLYAGTYWDGIWKYDLRPTVPLRVKPPKAFTLYPNPTNTSEITLSYQLPEAQKVQIIILDNKGQQLKAITRQHAYRGNYQEIIDVSDLATGTYFCTLRDKTGNHTKKLVITRP